MEVDDAATGIYDLCASFERPQSLETLGSERENLEKPADRAY